MKRRFVFPLLSCLLLFLNFRAGAQLGPGDAAPDFTVTDVHGGTHQLSSYLNNGKYVVLDFFFYNCIPCQYYTPQIDQAFTEYGCNKHDVVFLGIDYNDNTASVLQFEQNFGGTYPSVSGTDGGGNQVVSSYQVASYPYVILIAPNDTIVREFDPPTMLVFDYYFDQAGILNQPCVAGIGNEGESESRVWPNPGNGEFTIEINSSSKYFIFDMMGREIQAGTMEKGRTLLDLASQSSGTYFLRIHDLKTSDSIRLVVD